MLSDHSEMFSSVFYGNDYDGYSGMKCISIHLVMIQF